MVNLFAMNVTASAISVAASPRAASVQWGGHLLAVILCQFHVLPGYNNKNRAVKPGRVSQLDDSTRINCNYKAVIPVNSGDEASRILDSSPTALASQIRRPIAGLCGLVIPPSRNFLPGRPY